MKTIVGRMATGVVLAVLVGACGSDPVGNDGNDVTVEDLEGTWMWVQSMGGIAGSTLTPATEGFSERLVISAPDEIELFRDGESLARTTFTLTPADEPSQFLVVLRFTNGPFGFDEAFARFDAEGALILSDPCCDGFVREYAPN